MTPNSFNNIYKDINEKKYFGNTRGISNTTIFDIKDKAMEKVQFYISYNKGR